MKGKKLLIVEDEVIIAYWLQSELQKFLYNVVSPVHRGADAIQAAIEHKPDIILMDIRLGDSIDGIQVMEAVIEQYNPVFIFMTGYDNPEFHQRADRLPHSGYVIKPVKVDIIHDIIKSLL